MQIFETKINEFSFKNNTGNLNVFTGPTVVEINTIWMEVL